jgi:cytochrome c556
MARQLLACLLGATFAFAQAPSEPADSVVSMKQLMLDVIHPASNDILLLIYRGGPSDEKEWTTARRSAATLAESGSLLMMPGRGRDQNNWKTDSKSLANAGALAYKAAQAKNTEAFASVAPLLDGSCTACHKHYRPNVFAREGGSK